MWAFRRVRRVSWTAKITNKEVLQRNGVGKINVSSKTLRKVRKNTYRMREEGLTVRGKIRRKRRLEMITTSFSKRKIMEIIESSKKKKIKENIKQC